MTPGGEREWLGASAHRGGDLVAAWHRRGGALMSGGGAEESTSYASRRERVAGVSRRR
jgi:hypothetical protein